jgi:bidirectional [NiFe] hydrogenase diaphorase subunit
MAADPTTLIEVLHQRQRQEGHLSPATLHQVASQLALPLSKVVGVASFYHLFRRRPPAAHRWTLCFGTACFVLGAPQLATALETCLAEGPSGWELERRSWEVERSGCMGACGRHPLLRHNDDAPLPIPLHPADGLAARLNDSLGRS